MNKKRKTMRSKETQIGGDHYSKRKIQPFDIIDEYDLDYYEGAALKYLLRHKDKNGKEDLLKLKDYADCIIDRQYPEKKEIIDGGRACGKSYWTTCTSNVSFDGIESPIGDCTTYYGVVVDAYVFGVVVDAYVFKSCLTDKQLEEATGEDWHIYREADKLSVTTGFSLEQLVSAFRYMEFLAGLYNVFYRSDRVLEYVIPYSRGNFNKLLDEIYFYFSC